MTTNHALKIGSKFLHNEKPFTLPVDLVTQTVAILARKGKGKSYLAAVMAEELMLAEQIPVIIDPTGAHWGIKSSADGLSEGFQVVIFGGDHADIPIAETSGDVVAQAIVEGRFPAVLDLSLMRKGAANRFLGAFLETLYRLNRKPLHLICDEADMYAPQRPFGDEARTLGAMEDIVRRGRIRGIGCTLVTQRPQILNKNVLTQAEMLVTLGLSHPKDIAAIKEWIDVHASIEESKAMMDSLPVLPAGRAWFWAPGWGNIFDLVNVRERQTFNSGRTPQAGETINEPKAAAQINIAALGKQISEMMKAAVKEDPAALRRELTAAKRKIQELEEAPKRSLVDDVVLQQIEAACRQALDYVDMLRNPPPSMPLTFAALADARNMMASQQAKPVTPTIPESARKTGSMVDRNDTMSPVSRKFLTVLAQRQGKATTRSQIAILAGYSVKSRHVDNTLSSLRVRGFLMGSTDNYVITPPGLEALGAYKPLPRGQDLINYWLDRLDIAPRKFLEILVGKYPYGVTRNDLAKLAGYSPTSRHVDNSLSYLRVRELIDGNRDSLVASPELF